MREYPEAGPVRVSYTFDRDVIENIYAPITEADGKHIIHPGDTLAWWHPAGRGIDMPEVLVGLTFDARRDDEVQDEG